MPFKTPEAKRAYHRRWLKQNRSKVKIYQQRWKAKNRPKDRAYLRKHYAKKKSLAFQLLGNRCANPACQWLNSDGSRGCVDLRCLQVDHIYNNGNAERRSGVQTLDIYGRILAGKGHYQLLCANCNWIKRFA